VACHQVSVAGSPRLGDKAAWAPRIQTGMDSLLQSVVKGKGAMPPRGGNPSLSDAEVRAAVEFMVGQAK
jgi:cytochrome c5